MNGRAWALFAAVSTLWGIPYLFIKIAVDGGMPPLMLAWGRIVLAAVVLLGLGQRAGVLRQARGHLRALVAYAVLEVCIPFPLIASGEQHVSSSLAAIIIASVPLAVALLALRFDPEERTTGVFSLVSAVSSWATGASLTAVTAIVRVATPLRLLTAPPSLAWMLTVRTAVLGASLVFSYRTARSAVWYAATVAAPLSVSTPLAALKLPVMPSWSAKLSTSCPAA